ncbi:MAG: hypothetical protein IEMM0002_1055 [bacterium]|nr:MAG: hypothetical protein IEMM0002_1055 [bacterium]
MSEFKTLLAVCDLMNKKLVSIKESESIEISASRMTAEDVSSLLVLTDDGRVAGIVTEQDIVRRGVAAGLDITQTAVSQIMTGDPVHIESDQSIFEARSMMTGKKLNHLVVVKEKKPVGILTAANVLGS